MIALCLDISYTNIGWCVVESSLNAGVAVVKAAGVIQTKKSKTEVSGTKDCVDRCYTIFREMALPMSLYTLDCVVVESMSWPRNASSATKMALAWGAVGSWIGALPVVTAAPQSIKLDLTGSRSADKAEVEAAVRSRLSDLSISLLEASVPKASLREHCWDALGAFFSAKKRGNLPYHSKVSLPARLVPPAAPKKAKRR